MNSACSLFSPQPWTAWVALTIDTAALLTASASVIGHRTARIQAAGAAPSASDQRELTLMVHEKVEAVYGAWQAMARKLSTVGPQLVASGYEQMATLSSAMTALAVGPAPEQASALRAQAAAAACECARSGSRITDAMASVADAGLKSIHATVSANVTRLAA